MILHYSRISKNWNLTFNFSHTCILDNATMLTGKYNSFGMFYFKYLYAVVSAKASITYRVKRIILSNGRLSDSTCNYFRACVSNRKKKTCYFCSTS